jgi:hypothetical protein
VTSYRTETTGLWICGQFACGEPGRLPWKTLRVSHRAPLCPQAPQTTFHLYISSNPTYKGSRPKSRGKRDKTAKLEIHESVKRPPAADVPQNSRFKGYQDFVVQDIRIGVHNTRYRLERWVTPEGERLIGQLPTEIGGMHFGPQLRAFILYQYHHAHVTQPLLLEELREWQIDISAGQLSALITDGHTDFHREKDALLQAGLQGSRYVQVDDTGARHQGKNGYCTHIGNERFAWFASTGSKSRINFLELLRAGHDAYTLNEAALAYMAEHKLPGAQLQALTSLAPAAWTGQAAWQALLAQQTITDPRHVRVVTEGALLGTVVAHGVAPDLAILSDDAGQFDVLIHALCWIHAERVLAKLLGFNAPQRAALASTRSELWAIYDALKAYKKAPDVLTAAAIEARFGKLCATRTGYASLDQALKRMRRNQAELLRVLQRPELPLHNNLSESDIRDYVKKRKISGSTRSPSGRRCRDTFASLKKTCRKNGLSFWKYLEDRIFGWHRIAPLGQWIFEGPPTASIP